MTHLRGASDRLWSSWDSDGGTRELGSVQAFPSLSISRDFFPAVYPAVGAAWEIFDDLPFVDFLVDTQLPVGYLGERMAVRNT